MQYTPNFNLNLPEGTDVVNPLVQDNPNYTAIDAAMFANKQAVIGSATELVSGTAHAITRSNTDSNYFRFTATGNWTAGDTMTVDGNPVSVYLTDGTTPATGAYVINSEVFAMLAGSRLTLITSGKTNSIPASGVTFNNSGTGLSATDAQAAISELAGYKLVVSIPADSAMTNADQLAAVKPYFDALSTEEKISSILLYQDSLKMECNGLQGQFAGIANAGGTPDKTWITSVALADARINRIILAADNTIDYRNISTDTGKKFNLYIKK